MKSPKYYINLTFEEQKQVILSLIDLKNALIEQGKYTDAVDDVIYKVAKARTKKFRIISNN